MLSSSSMPRLPWIVALEILRYVPWVSSQSTDAFCLPQFGWTFNSRNQSPCLVGAYLQSVCIPNFSVPALPAGNHYNGPALNTANNCACSTVTYSLLSACGTCQNRTIIPWATWSAQCSDSMKSIASYPNEIPALTSVPSWAYLNIEETNDIWDLPRAQGLVGAPESTGSPIPRSTATESTTTATEAQNTFSSGVPTPTTAASQRSSGVNAGAIAGGVVGGVAFLAIVAVIGFWHSLRKKQRNDETEVNVFESHLPTSSTTPYNTAVASGSVMRETPGHRSQQGSIVSLNTYSPPITDRTNSSSYFMSPTSPATSAAYTTFDPYAPRRSLDNMRPNRGFSGAPEI
ncbi:hypothetical protein PTI98_003029 [Pleurotus ostreatus]|nr:hypothetical protein PTI98_003029 [Pleurotus ostreatus]